MATALGKFSARKEVVVSDLRRRMPFLRAKSNGRTSANGILESNGSVRNHHEEYYPRKRSRII